ncbi:uncharacterized protein LOC129753195 [Uranotaenia lowii]|uniref:uncharacterized protein LOC129753195 n=1 Tax=Uranotaenia lowii TaxID=190385 RepID=UPI002478C1F3|nr:uncharacterized protein LOC129753195 [Uranotaenia lowii]
MDIKKDIPSTLYFMNRRGRIYYEGLKFKCFICKEEGHLKVNCPKKQTKSGGPSASSANNVVETSENQKKLESISYANAVKTVGNLTNERVEEKSEKLQLNMEVLKSSRDESSIAVPRNEAEHEQEMESETSDEEMETSNTEKVGEKLGKRPLLSAERSTSDTDGDARGFRSIERSRKKLYKAGGVDSINPLQIIAKASQERGNNMERSVARTRSRSRVDDEEVKVFDVLCCSIS